MNKFTEMMRIEAQGSFELNLPGAKTDNTKNKQHRFN